MFVFVTAGGCTQVWQITTISIRSRPRSAPARNSRSLSQSSPRPWPAPSCRHSSRSTSTKALDLRATSRSFFRISIRKLQSVLGRHLAVFFLLAFAAARRSVFLRRDARFLTLSLPWLFPITLHPRPSSASAKLFRKVRVRKLIKGITAFDGPAISYPGADFRRWCGDASRRSVPAAIATLIMSGF